MNVIVTGATGFLGKYFVERLLQEAYQVYAVARSPEKLGELARHPNLHVIERSLEDFEAEDMPSLTYDCFFHLAWNGVNRQDIDDPKIHRANYENSVKCIQIAGKLGCRCFIDCGSKAEYGFQDGKQQEGLECAPYNAYGREKLHFYSFAWEYAAENHLLYAHPRFFSVIGIHDHPWSLVATACRKLDANEEMSFGACRQLWNFMDIADAVTALLKLYEGIDRIDATDNRIFNIAGYDTRVLRSFIDEIYLICESSSRLIFQDNSQNGRTDYMDPDIEKLVTLTGWKPQITFEQAIRKIVQYNRGINQK